MLQSALKIVGVNKVSLDVKACMLILASVAWWLHSLGQPGDLAYLLL